MKQLLPNEDSSNDSDCERPAMALKSLRTAVFALRTKDAPGDIEHENVYGALSCDDDDHDEHGLNPSGGTSNCEGDR